MIKSMIFGWILATTIACLISMFVIAPLVDDPDLSGVLCLVNGMIFGAAGIFYGAIFAIRRKLE